MQIVQIVMGSDSDEPTVAGSGMYDILNEASVDFGVSICSAHRDPEALTAFCENALAEQAKVFIGVAGLAAALPGAIAANVRAEAVVIGVPLDEHGIDSCLYMPPGIPVLLAGVGKTGLRNAAIAACQVVGIKRPTVVGELDQYLRKTKKPPKFFIDQ